MTVGYDQPTTIADSQHTSLRSWHPHPSVSVQSTIDTLETVALNEYFVGFTNLQVKTHQSVPEWDTIERFMAATVGSRPRNPGHTQQGKT